MLALSREIALLGLALLAAVALLGCGGGAAQSKSSSPGKSSSAKNAGKGADPSASSEHSIDMFPVALPQGGGPRSAVVRIGSVAISKAAYAHLAEALTPKIASYEPKSRFSCSSVRAPLEVKLAANEPKKLSATQIKALCIRQKQDEVKQSALQQLISAQWLIGEAAELGIGVSQAEAQRRVEQYAAQQFKSRAEFLSNIAATGRTLADTVAEIRAQMAGERIQKLIEQKASKKLDDAAIARYYHEHKSSFEVPESRDVRAIRTWTRSAIASAMAEVRAGKSIASVARRVSIDHPASEHGGLTEGIVRGQEEAGLDQAIFAAKPHVLTGPLHLRKRYYAFEVVKVTPGRRQPLGQIEASVRKKLSEELLRSEEASFVEAFRKKWIARTSCSPGYVISRCREHRGPSGFSAEPYELR